MKIDGALLTTKIGTTGDAARPLEAQGFDGLLSFEGPHDPFLPLAVAAEHPCGNHPPRLEMTGTHSHDLGRDQAVDDEHGECRDEPPTTRHLRWPAERSPAGRWRSLFSREKAKEDVGSSPVRLTLDSKAPRVEARGAGVGRGVLRLVLLQWSYCSRRSLRALSEGLECPISRAVADGRAR